MVVFYRRPGRQSSGTYTTSQLYRKTLLYFTECFVSGFISRILRGLKKQKQKKRCVANIYDLWN